MSRLELTRRSRRRPHGDADPTSNSNDPTSLDNNNDNNSTVVGRRRGLDLPMGTYYHPTISDDYFYAILYVGTPAQRIEMALDTGSGLPYFACQSTCQKCGKHEDPYFKIEDSNSFEWIQCDDSLCGNSGRKSSVSNKASPAASKAKNVNNMKDDNIHNNVKTNIKSLKNMKNLKSGHNVSPSNHNSNHLISNKLHHKASRRLVGTSHASKSSKVSNIPSDTSDTSDTVSDDQFSFGSFGSFDSFDSFDLFGVDRIDEDNSEYQLGRRLLRSNQCSNDDKCMWTQRYVDHSSISALVGSDAIKFYHFPDLPDTRDTRVIIKTPPKVAHIESSKHSEASDASDASHAADGASEASDAAPDESPQAKEMNANDGKSELNGLNVQNEPNENGVNAYDATNRDSNVDAMNEMNVMNEMEGNKDDERREMLVTRNVMDGPEDGLDSETSNNKDNNDVDEEETGNFVKKNEESIRMVFGCSQKEANTIFRQLADGVMGLSMHHRSFVDQLFQNTQIAETLGEKQFAHCFGEETGGLLLFGSNEIERVLSHFSITPKWTPFLSSGSHGWYRVKTIGFEVRDVAASESTASSTASSGASAVSGETPHEPIEVKYVSNLNKGYHGSVIDTGSSTLSMPEVAARPIREGVLKIINDKVAAMFNQDEHAFPPSFGMSGASDASQMSQIPQTPQIPQMPATASHASGASGIQNGEQSPRRRIVSEMNEIANNAVGAAAPPAGVMVAQEQMQRKDNEVLEAPTEGRIGSEGEQNNDAAVKVVVQEVVEPPQVEQQVEQQVHQVRFSWVKDKSKQYDYFLALNGDVNFPFERWHEFREKYMNLFPNISMIFDNDMDFLISGQRYLLWKKNHICLDLFGDTPSILVGSNVMINKFMIYDRAGMKLGIADFNCDDLIYQAQRIQHAQDDQNTQNNQITQNLNFPITPDESRGPEALQHGLTASEIETKGSILKNNDETHGTSEMGDNNSDISDSSENSEEGEDTDSTVPEAHDKMPPPNAGAKNVKLEDPGLLLATYGSGSASGSAAVHAGDEELAGLVENGVIYRYNETSGSGALGAFLIIVVVALACIGFILRRRSNRSASSTNTNDSETSSLLQEHRRSGKRRHRVGRE